MKFERESLWAEYVPLSQLATQSQAWHEKVLGVICYNKAKTSPTIFSPIITVDMPELITESVNKSKTNDGVCEVWHSKLPLTIGSSGPVHYRYNEHVLFGCLSLDEHEIPTPNLPLQIITEQAYTEIFKLINKLHYDSILRIWNYFPAINVETYGIERYRQFNIGRQNAFLANHRATAGNVPTSSVIGSGSGSLNIAFLAIRNEVVSVENPRQVSAYFYPEQYCPRAPIFSRAGLVNLNAFGLLLVSGTASIIGHRTVHCGDVASQTQESMNNLSLVVEAAKSQCSSIADIKLSDLAYKVYVRHPTDLPVVCSALQTYVGENLQVIYLQADICRADLLVEIEATNCHLPK